MKHEENVRMRDLGLLAQFQDNPERVSGNTQNEKMQNAALQMNNTIQMDNLWKVVDLI